MSRPTAPPEAAGRDERPAYGLGAPAPPCGGAGVFDPPDRGLHLRSCQARLLQLQRLPRFHPGVGGQAGLDPAG